MSATLNRRRARDKPRKPPRYWQGTARFPAASDDGAMTSIAKRLPVALTALSLALSAAPASATTVPSHLPARGTDVAAPDQQAPRELTHLPALGTDVAAVDQQARVAPAPASGAKPSGDGISPLTLVFALIALAAAALATYSAARGRRRVPQS